MGKQKQALQPFEKPKPPALTVVPSPPESKKIIKELNKLDTEFNEAFEAYEVAEQTIEKYLYSQKGWTAFLLGWTSVSSEKAFITDLPGGVTPKKEMTPAEWKEVYDALDKALAALSTLVSLSLESAELISEIHKKDISEAKAKKEYLNLDVNLFYMQNIISQYEQGATAAEMEYIFETKTKYEQPTISKQKGKVIPVEQTPLIELPPTMTDLFIYGPGQPVYYDPYTGTYGSKQSIDFARDIESGKVDLNSGVEDFMILIPFFGPAICVVNDIDMIKYGTEKEKLQGKLMLVVDVAFMGIDVHWLVHLGVRSATQLVARDALLKMAEEKTAGALITKTEMNVFSFAAQELSEKEMKEILKIAQRKGGWNVVAKELLELAESSKKISKGKLNKQILKDYISYESGAKKKVKGFFKEIYHDFAGVTQKGFEKHSKEFLAREMLYGTNFKYMNYGAMLDKLSTPQKKVALSAIFNANMTFSHGAQKELWTFVNKKGWGPILSAVEKEVGEIGGEKAVQKFLKGTLDNKTLAEAAKNAMQDLFPKYSLAYAISPFKEWIKLGAYLGATAVAFKYARIMGDYVMAKGKDMIEKAEKEKKKFEASLAGVEALPEVTEEDIELQAYTAGVSFEDVFNEYMNSALGE